MTCHNCKIEAVKAGKDDKGNQRFKCNKCKRRFQAEQEKLLGNMYLPEEKALMVLQLLVEGNSIRSITRITGIEKKTILTLLSVAGERCEDLMNRKMRKVKVNDLQLDEIWTFCRMKEKVKTRQGIDQRSSWRCLLLHSLRARQQVDVDLASGRRTEQDTVAFIERFMMPWTEHQHNPDHKRWFRALPECNRLLTRNAIQLRQLVKITAHRLTTITSIHLARSRSLYQRPVGQSES